jgi:hypothetical protein
MAKDFELLVLFTSTPGLAVDIQMAEMMKDLNPKLKVCFVGPPVTVEPEKVLGASRAIDFVVRREFDHQIVDYANGKPLTTFRTSASAAATAMSTTPKAAISRTWTTCPG